MLGFAVGDDHIRHRVGARTFVRLRSLLLPQRPLLLRIRQRRRLERGWPVGGADRAIVSLPEGFGEARRVPRLEGVM